MSVMQVSRHAELQGKIIRRLLRRGGRGRINKVLANMRTEDVAMMLRSFTPSEQLETFRILISDFPEEAPLVVVELDPQSRLGLLQDLKPETIARLVELVKSDDAVFILDSLPEELKGKVYEILEVEEERFSDVQAQLLFEEDTAGRIMDRELIALPEDTEVGDAIEKVRTFAQDVDMISYLYVVDDHGRLVGVAPLRSLLLAEPSQTLAEIMSPSVIQVHTDTDQEEVAQLASRYDLLAIPVCDEENRLVGIVTIDDIVDIFKEEATEDFYKMVGTSDDELVYQDRSFKVAGIRLPWILFNLVGLLGASVVVTRYEESFTPAILVGFIPVIMGMSGNIGSQTSTITVRGLATGRLQVIPGELRKYAWQQLKVGMLLSLVCTSLVALAAFAFGRELSIALAVGTALFCSVLLASFNGVFIPVLFRRLGIDPALASGPLVTTSNDLFAVLIYFGISHALLTTVVA
ncbi:MAG: magnesium transporter [Holophagales bacterium]|nr:magnesium transporter [Holophagales bacterium]